CAFQSGPAPCAMTMVPTWPSARAPLCDATDGDAGRWASTDAGATMNSAASTATIRDRRVMLRLVVSVNVHVYEYVCRRALAPGLARLTSPRRSASRC